MVTTYSINDLNTRVEGNTEFEELKYGDFQQSDSFNTLNSELFNATVVILKGRATASKLSTEIETKDLERKILLSKTHF